MLHLFLPYHLLMSQDRYSKTRTNALRSRVITKVLVQWLGFSTAEATWESLHQLQLAFPYIVGKAL